MGRRANFSIWDADSLEELHENLQSLPMHPWKEICERSNARYLLRQLIEKGRIIRHSHGWYTRGLSAHKAKSVTVPMDADSIGNLGPVESTGTSKMLQAIAGLVKS